MLDSEKTAGFYICLSTQPVVVIDKHAGRHPHTDVFSNWKTKAYLNSMLSQ